MFANKAIPTPSKSGENKGIFKKMNSTGQAGSNSQDGSSRSLTHGSDLDIFKAASAGSLNLLKDLIAAGQPIDATDESRRTALHHGSRGGYYELVDYLLAAKADPKAKTKENGWTPLHEASSGEVAELLILAKAEVNDFDAWGMSPLHIAAKEGNIDVVRCLVQYKALLNPKDGLGRTPLHLASQNGHLEVVQELASDGANLHSLDNKHRTARDNAMSYGHREITKEFEKIEELLGTMGVGGESLRALPAGSPARLAKGPNNSPIVRPKTADRVFDDTDEGAAAGGGKPNESQVLKFDD